MLFIHTINIERIDEGVKSCVCLSQAMRSGRVNICYSSVNCKLEDVLSAFRCLKFNSNGSKILEGSSIAHTEDLIPPYLNILHIKYKFACYLTKDSSHYLTYGFKRCGKGQSIKGSLRN